VTLNVSLLKHHYGAGVTGAIKNVAFGGIQSPGSFHTSHNPSDPNAVQRSYIPAIFNLSRIKDRMASLHIMEGFFAIRDRGPDVAITDVTNQMFFSTDPLTLDSRALARVNDLRTAAGLSQVSASLTDWMNSAAAMGLGNLGYELTSLDLTS
jgi:hypothetical protein